MPFSRRIDPASRAPRPDGEAIASGLSQLALAEWEAQGLALPDLEAMRRYRLDRIVEQLVSRGIDALLCYDPINIRYITDCPNMQVWIARNPCRAAFVSAAGYLVLWDFHGCAHLSAHLPLVREVRSGAGALAFDYGEHSAVPAMRFAAELRAVLREHAGAGNRLALDRADGVVVDALREAGIELVPGQQLCEAAREIKSLDEVRAMRCAIAACDASVAEMHAALAPGISENALWAHLHAGNIRRGGEWIETRLLSSGPRTNPWYQECGGRELVAGDLLAFDTDLIGTFGMCVDYSRTWLVGDGPASVEQRALHAIAREHIDTNRALLRPGALLGQVSAAAHRLPEPYRAQRYAMIAHGVGLCDEYPCIRYPEDAANFPADEVLQPGMILSVEAYVGAVGGAQGVKLEDMVLITEHGNELLTHYPFDARLCA